MQISPLSRPLAAIIALTLAACATVQPSATGIKETSENETRGCKMLGDVSGSDAIFVGLSASVGSKNARAKALNQAADLGANTVAWSQRGTSMTNEWIGKAYRCKG